MVIEIHFCYFRDTIGKKQGRGDFTSARPIDCFKKNELHYYKKKPNYNLL